MRVERRSLLAGAADAQGIVVVIDVLRAFSCSALMFHYGVRDLALVRTPQEALAFRDRDPDYLVAGEVKGVKVEGFDLGNSPADIVAKGEAFFRNRRVAVRSSCTASTVTFLRKSLSFLRKRVHRSSRLRMIASENGPAAGVMERPPP